MKPLLADLHERISVSCVELVVQMCLQKVPQRENQVENSEIVLKVMSKVICFVWEWLCEDLCFVPPFLFEIAQVLSAQLHDCSLQTFKPQDKTQRQERRMWTWKGSEHSLDHTKPPLVWFNSCDFSGRSVWHEFAINEFPILVVFCFLAVHFQAIDGCFVPQTTDTS